MSCAMLLRICNSLHMICHCFQASTLLLANRLSCTRFFCVSAAFPACDTMSSRFLLSGCLCSRRVLVVSSMDCLHFLIRQEDFQKRFFGVTRQMMRFPYTEFPCYCIECLPVPVPVSEGSPLVFCECLAFTHLSHISGPAYSPFL